MMIHRSYWHSQGRYRKDSATGRSETLLLHAWCSASLTYRTKNSKKFLGR